MTKTALAVSAPGRAGALPAYEPFPVHALPRPLAAFVGEGAAALGCDAAMVALPAVAVCGSLVGNTRTVRLKSKWHEPSVVWTCVVADSGTCKSPALDLAIQPLYALQKRLRQEHAVRMTAYLAALEQWKAMKTRDAANAAPKPEQPPLPRVVCSDTTIESLCGLLDDNHRGLLLARDELAGWFGSFTRYKGKGAASDLQDWLSMHRAGQVTVDRKTSEKRAVFIDRAAVSVCGTIQPSILAKAVRGDFLDSGLVARLLLAMPPKTRKQWRNVDLDPATADAYGQLLDNLYRLDFRTNGMGERVPIALALDADAQEAWIEFFNQWAGEQFDAEGERAAALSKLEGYAARFALLHHVCGRTGAGLDDRVPIGADSTAAGATLCRWFARESERVYHTFGETAEQRETRRLIEFVQSHGGAVTARELQRANARKYPYSGAAECALAALAGAGYGSWTDSTRHGAGRPSKVFRLHGSTDGNGTAPVRDEKQTEPPARLPTKSPSPVPTQPLPPLTFSTVDENGEFDPLASPWR